MEAEVVFCQSSVSNIYIVTQKEIGKMLQKF